MTNLEALQSIIGFEIDKNLLIKNLQDFSLNPDDVYIADNKDKIELCSAFVLRDLIAQPSEIKEGNLSVKNDKKMLINRANKIFLKFGYTSELINIRKIKIY